MSTDPHGRTPTSMTADGMKELERQVERGNLFAHSALAESVLRLREAEALVHGLSDVLIGKGIVLEGELAAALEQVQSELGERREPCASNVIIRVDDEAADTAPVEVDCQARLPVCKAVCCRLDFALSVAEVEGGPAKWDLGRPYFIRRTSDGRCTHHDDSGACQIYAQRPGVCRRYTCANDPRIWKDFDRWELNTEWIDANLSTPTRPRALDIRMQSNGRASTSGAPR